MHGGDLNGFVLIRGSTAQIDALKRSAEFENLMMRGIVNIEGLGANDAYIGGGVDRLMQMYVKALGT